MNEAKGLRLYLPQKKMWKNLWRIQYQMAKIVPKCAEG